MKTDPRTRLVIMILLTSLAVFAPDAVYLSALFLTALVIDIIYKVSLVNAVKRLKHLLSLIIFIALVQSLTVSGGTALVHIGKVNLVTTAGLLAGASFALRMGIIILSSLLVAQEDNGKMIDALIKLKIPYEIAFMVSIALRFLPMFREEFSARLTALKLRGIEFKKLNLTKKLKAYSYLLSSSVAGSILKSRELAKAMDSKGFRAYPKRTMLRTLRLKFIDYAFIIIISIYSAAFIACLIIFGEII